MTQRSHCCPAAEILDCTIAGDHLDCGCAVLFAPCEAHLEKMKSGEERVNIAVRFDDKYSHFAGNTHGVDLERVQRIELGIDSEPMEFNEGTIAYMLQALADDRPFETEAFVLRALVNALRGNDDHHRLVLRQKKPGKWESPTEHEERWNRDMSWLWTLGSLERAGMKTEAAIARISELSGASRAAVFAGVRSAEKRIHDAFWMFQPKGFQGPPPAHLCNPRPSKKSDS